MIFKKLRNNFSLLIDSSRHVWTFELAYKLVAFAVIFPIVLFAINFLMKIAGVNYLTNEYIQRAMTHPVVIFAIFLAVGIFVFYCTYEMTYLSVCFETREHHVMHLLLIYFIILIRFLKMFLSQGM